MAKSRWQKIALKKVTEKRILEEGSNIQMIPVKSSNVKAIGYDGARRILQVDFLNGSRYQYYDVPRETWEAVKRGGHQARYPIPHFPSVGSALDAYVKKKGYEYKRIK